MRKLNSGTGAQKMTPPTAAYAAEEEAPAGHKETGFVAVCAGEGLKEIFLSLGADVVISGGQTMNPSTADIMDAIDKVDADTVFVLPNNKNIILAANQAKDMDADKRIEVVPTKTVPQGVSALISFMEGASAEENMEAMLSAIAEIKSGEVTHAIRDTSIDGVEIREGDFMAIGDEGILSAGKDRTEILMEMLEKMTDEDTALISVYYGEDIDEEEAEAIEEKIRAAYDNSDVEVQCGGQPVYYYIVSVE